MKTNKNTYDITLKAMTALRVFFSADEKDWSLVRERIIEIADTKEQVPTDKLDSAREVGCNIVIFWEYIKSDRDTHDATSSGIAMEVKTIIGRRNTTWLEYPVVLIPKTATHVRFEYEKPHLCTCGTKHSLENQPQAGTEGPKSQMILPLAVANPTFSTIIGKLNIVIDRNDGTIKGVGAF